MTDSITADDLEGMIGERVKDLTGMEASEFRELGELLKANRTAVQAETEARLSAQGAEDVSKGYAKSPYAKAAAAEMRIDARKGLGWRTARKMRAAAGANLLNITPEDFALKHYEDPSLADSFRAARESLQGNSDMSKMVAVESSGSGGVLLGLDDSADIIELLTAQLVVLQMGAIRVPMASPDKKLGRIVTGVTSGFDGEQVARNSSEPDFGAEELSLKKIRTIMGVTNESLLMGHPALDRILRDEMLRSLSNRKEQSMIRDDGASTNLRGIRYLADTVSARTQAGAASTLDEVVGDLFDMLSDVEDADIKLQAGQAGWLMRAGLRNKLMSLRDGTGGFLFRDELSSGRLLGFPVGTTSIIPNNLGGGGDESEIYFGDFSQLLVGEWAGGMIFSAQDGASFKDSSGTTRLGFSEDLQALKLTGFVDINIRHREAFSVRTNVDWQADTIS